MKKRAKREATYKQMAFETAIRSPERYKDILKAVQSFVGKILTKETLLDIVASLYLNSVVKSEELIIDEFSTLENICAKVEHINRTRNSDGGFPKGYCARFWTYMRTMSELGLVYAQYEEEFKLSKIAKMLIEYDLDEQEVFSMQAMKYNRKSPYRNVSNDFNFFKFILKVLDKRKRISYEQFVVATFSDNGNVAELNNILDNNVFKDENEVYEFLKIHYKTTLKQQTIVKDYPDVVLRLLIITGFVSIEFKGKLLIYSNSNRAEYISELCNVQIDLTDEQKNNSSLHFQKLETYNAMLLEIVNKHKHVIQSYTLEYTEKVAKIIKTYEISEIKLLESITAIGSSRCPITAFKYIAEPLKLEFYISLLLVHKYGNQLGVQPNYKADDFGMPISHAAGGRGDIEVFAKDFYWLIEVTLIRNKAQQINNETTSVMRHLTQEKGDYKTKYLSFVAPVIHLDTRSYYDISVVQQKIHKQNLYLKPYNIEEFIKVTVDKKNLEDMKAYTEKVILDFKTNLFD